MVAHSSNHLRRRRMTVMVTAVGSVTSSMSVTRQDTPHSILRVPPCLGCLRARDDEAAP